MVLRIGLVGHGRWGRNIERTLSAFTDVSLRIIGRGEPPPNLDGVLIATPSTTHTEIALPYLAKGIATFIEKPMATSVVDAERIRETATRSGAPVFVGHIHLYNPAFQTLLDTLPKLGRLRYAVHEGMNGNPRQDSSVLWDWLPHSLSMAHMIFGTYPKSVTTQRLAGSSLIEAAASSFQFEEMSLRSIVSWLSQERRHRMTISGSAGTIIFDDKAKKKLVLSDAAGHISYPTYDDELPLTRELREFLQMISRRQVRQSHIDQDISMIRTIAAAEQSAAQDGKLIQL